MIYSSSALDPSEKLKKIALPHDKVSYLNNSEKERLRRHLTLFAKLRSIITKMTKKSVQYIKVFMAKILQVDSHDIYDQDAEKLISYLLAEKVPNPQLNLRQILLWILHNNK